MTPLFKYIAPLLGTKGVYTLITPFVATEGETLECIGIRTLSDWVANNDDALTEIYLNNTLSEDDYGEDLSADMEIASLRNDRGLVYHVPVKYISSYPVQDGINYRSVAIMTALPAMRTNQDFSVAIKEIGEVISANFGVKSSSKIVVTSHGRAIPSDADAVLTAQRKMVIGDSSLIYAKLAEKDNEIETLKNRITVLEAALIAAQK